MKKCFSIGVLLFMLLASAVNVHAQSRLSMQIGYSVNNPSGHFKDVVNKTSYRGFMGNILYDVNENVAVGLGMSYADFYQKNPRDVYATQIGDISAVLTNSIQVIPIVAKAQYSFLKQGLVRPFVGVGAGVNLVNFDQYFGEFPSSSTIAKPAFSAEGGVRFAIGTSGRTGIHVGAHYNYLPYKVGGFENLNSWGGQIGVFFPLR